MTDGRTQEVAHLQRYQGQDNNEAFFFFQQKQQQQQPIVYINNINNIKCF